MQRVDEHRRCGQVTPAENEDAGERPQAELVSFEIDDQHCVLERRQLFDDQPGKVRLARFTVPCDQDVGVCGQAHRAGIEPVTYDEPSPATSEARAPPKLSSVSSSSRP